MHSGNVLYTCCMFVLYLIKWSMSVMLCLKMLPWYFSLKRASRTKRAMCPGSEYRVLLYHSNTCLRVLSCLEPVLQLKTNMNVNVNQFVPMFWVLFLVYIFFTNSLIKMCDKWYCTKKSSTTAPPIINSIRNKYTSIKNTLE